MLTTGWIAATWHPFRPGVAPAVRIAIAVLTAGLLAAAAGPSTARAQSERRWTGIGAIAGTAMYMDTTAIVRSGAIRDVWIRSIDLAPRRIIAAADTLDFDTVIALNRFDCSRNTRTVMKVQYLLGGTVVLDVPETHADPELLRPRSFFAAIYRDLCAPSR